VTSSPRRARRPGLALALCALALSGCFLWPQPRGTEEHPTVMGVDIEGTHVVSASELLSHLATQPSGRRSIIIPDPQRFDLDAFANDKKRIARFYQTRGYYHAAVTSAEVIPDGRGRVRIRIRVDEGPPMRVTRLDLDGIDEAPEAKAKLKRLPLKVGDVFTESAYDAARGDILAALTSTGWAKAEVTQQAQVDPELNEAHVRYTVKAGARYQFGPLFVSGAAAIPRARIREEAELEVKPGDVYDATELPKAQGRIFDLGVFGGVRVNPSLQSADEQRKTVPVVVAVREAPFRTLRAGPGFTFQATRWEADAIAGWQHRNWLGGLRKLSLDARVGYAWLPTLFNSTKSGPVALVTADFTQPGIASRYVDLNVRAEAERGLELAYDFWAERLRLGTPFKLGRLVTFVPSLNLELYEITGAVSQTTVTTAGGQAPQTLQLATCPGQDPSLCLLSYFEQRLVFDFRDDPLNTTKGLYVALAVQEGFSFGGNGASYLRLLPEARAFVNLPLGLVLAGRARVGWMNKSPAEVPLVADFTSGGPNAMRGYYTRQLSPVFGPYCPVQLDKTGKCPTGTQFLPVGGAGLIDGSVEMRFPISGQLGGATFLDFGNVRFRAADALNVADLQYAVGAGIRYKTVFGPLRIDLAYRLPGPSGKPGVEILRLCPTTGCGTTATASSRSVLVPTGTFHHDPYISFHLTIGEAF
jgi:translocation and assembly module TamA